MQPIRERSLVLTGHLETLLKKSKHFVHPNDADKHPGLGFTIITPSDPDARGAQLSVLFMPPGTGVMKKVLHTLATYGVMGDEREPDLIRLAPAPLYNTLKDCTEAARYFEEVLDELALN